MIFFVYLLLNSDILSKAIFFFSLNTFLEVLHWSYQTPVLLFCALLGLLILYCVFQLVVDRSKIWKSLVLKWTLAEMLKLPQKVLSLDCMNTMS